MTCNFKNDKKIAVITLNNSKKRNALSKDMLFALKTRLEHVKLEYNGNDGTRVVVLKADGPVFSSGHDLKEVRKLFIVAIPYSCIFKQKQNFAKFLDQPNPFFAFVAITGRRSNFNTIITVDQSS